MTTKRHLYRPKGNHILICEDKIDSDFVSTIIRLRTGAITITHGKGRETLPKLAEIYQPASFYIWDRDFAFTVAEAEMSYEISFTKPRLIWTHVDIESYLLHPDWLFRFIEDAPSAYTKIKNPPSSQAEVENDLKQFAVDLVPDHAGRRTVEIVNKSLNMQKRGGFGIPSDLPDGKRISNRTEWETGLQDVAQTVQNNLQAGLANVELLNVLDIYSEQITEYRTYTSALDAIRINFSGKRILQLLADKWTVSGQKIGDGKFKDWEVIRKGLIDYAIDYAKGIATPLKDDDRLGDFGKIATKLTGKPI